MRLLKYVFKKISQLTHDHPVKKFVSSRKIPSDKHYLLYFAPKFYKFVNTLVENKFPSLDHPRLVIPFYNEKNELIALQGEIPFGNEVPKYITIKVKDSTTRYTEQTNWNQRVRC